MPRSARMPSTAVATVRIEHRAELPVVRVHRLEPIAKPASRSVASRERVGVAVDPDHAGRASLQQRPRVSAEAERAIDVRRRRALAAGTGAPPRAARAHVSVVVLSSFVVSSVAHRPDPKLRQRPRVLVGERLALELRRRSARGSRLRGSRTARGRRHRRSSRPTRAAAGASARGPARRFRRSGRSSSRGRGTAAARGASRASRRASARPPATRASGRCGRCRR